MKIAEIVSSHRNDFTWIGECSHCGHRKKYGDGYSDNYYLTKVAPARFCPECNLNCHGDKRPEEVTS